MGRNVLGLDWIICAIGKKKGNSSFTSEAALLKLYYAQESPWDSVYNADSRSTPLEILVPQMWGGNLDVCILSEYFYLYFYFFLSEEQCWDTNHVVWEIML